MEKYIPREEKEKFSENVNLEVQDHMLDKNPIVGFTGKSEAECEIYNCAIREVLEKENQNPFHQIGVTPDGQNKPGFHAWEVWRGADKLMLEKLLPKIEERVKELKEQWKVDNL